MNVQISSGQDPAEYELAVGLFAKELQKNYSDVEVVKFAKGQQKNCYNSIILKTDTIFQNVKGQSNGSVKVHFAHTTKEKIGLSMLRFYLKLKK